MSLKFGIVTLNFINLDFGILNLETWKFEIMVLES